MDKELKAAIHAAQESADDAMDIACSIGGEISYSWAEFFADKLEELGFSVVQGENKC